MIQFDIKRFGKLAQWTLSFDKGYYIRMFLQMFVVSVLLFAAFTTRFFTFNELNANTRYVPCALVFLGVLLVHLMIAPGVMFYSFKHKRDDQMYMMLPASNFEKYLARYVGSILLLFVYLVALLAGDLVQYLLNEMMGKGDNMFVVSFLLEKLSLPKFEEFLSLKYILSFACVLLCQQSFYAVGGTSFRSHKYAWIYTSIILIAGFMLLAWVMPDAELYVDRESTTLAVVLSDCFHLALAAFDFWLAYRFFCRQQVIGKFVNF